MPRKYEKKNLDYWNNISKGSEEQPSQPVIFQESRDWEPVSAGDPFYTSTASLTHVARASRSGAGTTNSANNGVRLNRSAFSQTHDRFSAIRLGMLPYSYGRDHVDIRDTVELCQKAYANIAVFRNAIDLMSEFANTEIYLDGGSKKANKFFSAWFKRIELWRLKREYFLEYFRSGNVFLYRIEGKFDTENFLKFQTSFTKAKAASDKLPVRYILLNPCYIVSKAVSSFNNKNYEKVLSKYDIQRLKNPVTDEDKAVFDALPKEVQKNIEKGAFVQNGVYMPLSEEQILTSFRKKQSYEPFAIPFGYPVLEDLNAKLELKKMDQAITRTVENAILLVTMGAPPDKNGNVQYPIEKNLTAMQALFKNESVGRVLVSDWTTEAEFIIPDLNKILGPQKYEVLDRDIKEGLQNVLIGEEKYGNTQAKIQVFLDKLREGRESFINDFLQPEIKRIAKRLGFRSYPEIKFKDIDAKDNTQFLRVATRLAELNLLTPDELMHAFNVGKLPSPEDIGKNQEAFRDQRKDGLFNPLSPAPVLPPPFDPNAPKPVGPPKAKVPTSPGRPNDTKTTASTSKMQEAIYAADDLFKHVENLLCEKYDIGELNDAQKQMADQIHEAIVCAAKIDEWNSLAERVVDDPNLLATLNPLSSVQDVAASMDLELYEAALLENSWV